MAGLHQHFNQREQGRFEFQYLLSAGTKLKRTPNLSETQQGDLEDAIRLGAKQRATTIMIPRCSSLLCDYVATQIEAALDNTVCFIDVPKMVREYDGSAVNKTVSRLYADAETRHWILLFNEADELFGKRAVTKNSHENYQKQDINYLLARANQHSGMSIFSLVDALPPSVSPKRFNYLL
ncbi:AAA family ATPase [Alteromonas sediminis]|uniref:AAA family ATPase n=1 Tax=Alteromonas sediminis TaxID=2259342 RepID=A0A3N5YCL6_9ALTE|nr:AAA family ATPase [Alteromonas sediminis]RPJ67005.1 AAA family ATPase [Alteromonas sediminis]